MRNIRTSFGSGYSALVFLFLAGLQVTSAGPIYSVQILGSLAGTSVSATAINGSGTGVGFITSASGNQIPVILNGQTTTLPGVGQANGINSSGTVIGTTYTNNVASVTEWAGGQATTLGITGYGTDINNSGQIVGGFTAGSGQTNAFLLNGGTLTNLGTLGGSFSTAIAINGAGQIVGNSLTSAGTFAAFSSNGKGMTNLCPSCAGSYANAINSTGTVVGTFVNGNDYMEAAEYSGGGAIALGTLGGNQSYAYGIDTAGAIVGSSYLSNNSTLHAFIYMNGVMTDLNSLLPLTSGWTISSAYGMNDSGDIVGLGTLNGSTYAVILDPVLSVISNVTAGNVPSTVPEPAPIFLTAGALSLLAAVFRYRHRTQLTHR